MYRSEQALSASRIYRQLAHDDGKIISLIYRLPLPPPPPKRCTWYSFLSETESTPGS